MGRKVTTLIMIAVTSILVACSGKNMGTAKVEVDNYAYDIIETKYDFDKDISILGFYPMYIRGNYLYFTADGTEAYMLEEENENGFHMCRYDIANDEFKVLYDDPDAETFGALYVTENEDIVMLRHYNEWNMETSAAEIRLSKVTYGNDGTEKENIVISDLGTDTTDMEYVSVRECKFDGKGNIYVVYEYNNRIGYDICMYDANGVFRNRVSIMDKIYSSMVFDNEGRAVVCHGGAVNNSEYCECAYLDFENGKQGEALSGLSAKDNIFNRCTLINSYGDIPFFISDGTLLYTYDEENKQPQALLNWLNTGILYDALYYIKQMDDGRIFCFAGDYMGFLEKNDAASDEREVLQLASLLNSSDSDIEKMIIKYNTDNTEYKIEYASYDDTKHDPESALMMDIAAGYAPDILLLGGKDANLLASRGLLCDLTPYIKEDDTVNEDYFVDGILDATESSGKHYYVVDTVRIDTIMGRKSELEDYQDDWTVDNIIDYYNPGSDDKMLCYYNTKSGVADLLIYSNLDRYIDWNKGKCSFDGKEFQRVLEFCNSFSDNDYPEDVSEYELIDKGEILLNESPVLGIDSITYIRAYNKVYQGDEIYLGYPDSGCRAYLDTQSAGWRCGIVPSSDHKDEAWKFIKELMLMRAERNYMDCGGFPTSKVKFEELMETSMAEYYKNEYGDMVSTYFLVGEDSYQISTGPATKEDVQTLRDLIKNSKTREYTYDIKLIIGEDIQDYFNGRKGIDDTVKVIQDRMSKYVNENR